ncbi:MAG: OadG family protein [Clostridia bacterium]|nr:OadG family protein [Clostridia bacterium]
MNILNALSYGGITAIVGILIVFTGLTILICAVSIMAKIFQSINAKKAERERIAQEAAQKAAEPVVETVSAPEPAEETVEDDPALIAVIAAAIAAFDDSGKQLVVRKVRRVSGWNAAARRDQIGRF